VQPGVAGYCINNNVLMMMPMYILLHWFGKGAGA
jgi:hypothetical protein